MTGPVAAEAVIAALDLRPHPEGGHYREIHRAQSPDGERAAVTSIYFLLSAGEVSRWHRVDATEIWAYHAGAPLLLTIAEPGGAVVDHRLGADLAAGQRPQAVVPPFAWQSARSLGAWTLVGCAVAPGFRFSGFEMAPAGWAPDADQSIAAGDSGPESRPAHGPR